jgi:hypothetical protein
MPIKSTGVRTSVYLSQDLETRGRAQAAKESRSFSSLMKRALKRYLDGSTTIYNIPAVTGNAGDCPPLLMSGTTFLRPYEPKTGEEMVIELKGEGDG